MPRKKIESTTWKLGLGLACLVLLIGLILLSVYWKDITSPKADDPISEATEAADPISEDAEAANPISEDAEAADPISEDAEAAEPISEATEAADPISEATEVADPISEATEAADPIPITASVALGGSCAETRECIGTNIACCTGKCTTKVLDWDNVGWCPESTNCLDAPKPLGKQCGTSSIKYPYPRSEGQPCITDGHCKNWIAANKDKVGNMTCCSGMCRRRLKDYLGRGKCPEDCINKIGGKRGTCD